MPLDSRGGFPTHWSRFGSEAAERKVLASHCSLAHAGSWKPLAAALGDTAQIIAYDHPGHGRSGDWDGLCDIQELSMNMAIDLLETECNGPADLLGHSFGATVMLRLACDRPELVRSLVLIEPVFFAVAYADDPSVKARHAASLAPYREALAQGDKRAAARAFTSVWGDGSHWDDIPAPMQEDMASRIHIVDGCTPQLNEDSAGLLRPGVLDRVTCPVLLLEGGDSPEFVSAINAGLARRLPKAQRGTVEGAGHMLPISHPAAVAKRVQTFWQS